MSIMSQQTTDKYNTGDDWDYQVQVDSERLEYILDRPESPQTRINYLEMPSLCTSTGNPLMPDSFMEEETSALEQKHAQSLLQKIDDIHNYNMYNRSSSRRSKRRSSKSKGQQQQVDSLEMSTAVASRKSTVREPPLSPNDVVTATLLASCSAEYADCNDCDLLQGMSALKRCAKFVDDSSTSGSSILTDLLKDEEEIFGSGDSHNSSLHQHHRQSTTITKECRNDDSDLTLEDTASPTEQRTSSRRRRHHESHDSSVPKTTSRQPLPHETKKKVVQFVEPLVTACYVRPRLTEKETRELFFDPDELHQLEMDRQETLCEDEVEMIASFASSKYKKNRNKKKHGNEDQHRQRVAQVLLSGVSTYSRRQHHQDLDRHRAGSSMFDDETASFDNASVATDNSSVISI